MAAVQATLSLALTLALGLPLAHLISRYEFPLRRWLSGLLLLPFLLPTVVTGLAVRQLLGPWLEPGLPMLLLAHAFVNLAVVVRLVVPVWSVLDERFAEVAAALGANRWDVARTVWWPALRPAVLSASGIVWVYCFNSLGLLLVLGGQQRTLESVILRQVGLLLDFKAAAATAATQLVVVSAVLLLTSRGPRGGAAFRGKSRRRQLPRPWQWLPAAVSLLLALPLLWLAVASVRGSSGWTAEWWSRLLDSGSPLSSATAAAVVGQSLYTALISGALGAALALAVAVAAVSGQHLIARLGLLPMGVSAVTLGLGLLLAASRWPLSALPRPALLPIAQVAFALPVLMAVVLPVIRSADARLLLVARSLGAGRNRALFTAYGPALARIASASFVLAAAVSLGEYGAASFLTSADAPTLPVEIMRLLSRPGAGTLGTAAALSVVLGVVATLLFVSADRLERATA